MPSLNLNPGYLSNLQQIQPVPQVSQVQPTLPDLTAVSPSSVNLSQDDIRKLQEFQTRVQSVTPEVAERIPQNISEAATIAGSPEMVQQLSSGYDITTPSGNVYESSYNAGNQGSGNLLGQYNEMIEKGAQYLTPYTEAGAVGLQGLQQGIESGQFLPGEFSYQGQQPGFGYEGQQLSNLGYGGQALRDLNYQGQPINRSIESYMQEDPGLGWQQEQLQKAIDRAGAAKGRWGGGATAREMQREQAGLLSQDYANRFARAQAERSADVGSEQEMYGRALTGFDIARGAEQSDYQRAIEAANMANLAEQSAYNRALQGYDIDRAIEQESYGRALTGYGLDANRAQQEYQMLSNLAGMGQGAATSLGGMYSGLGGQLLGQQFQQNMAGQQQATADDAAFWGGLGTIGGAVLGGIFGGPGGAAAGAGAGGALGGIFG
jgi:hypothetical protein